LGADPSGDLLLTDFLAWRVRRVAGIVPIVIPTSTSLTASAATVNAGASVTFTAKVAHTSGSTAPTGTVTFNNGTTKLGSGTLENTGSATFTTSSLAAGSYSVTAAYSGDTNYAPSTSSAVALGVQDFQIAANPTTVTVTAPGQSGTTTLTITPLGGFNQTLTYTCSGLPSGAACQSPSGATGGTLTITTAAASSKLEHPFGQSAGPFYALLLPGLLGLVVLPTGNRKHALRSMRWLGLLVIVALATLWMPACGGGSSSGGGGGGGGNPGTPTGTSTVTVTATTGGNSALTHSVTITLTVQ